LFKNRDDIPGEKEFPGVKPYLDSYKFPSDILTTDRLAAALKNERIEYIRRSITTINSANSVIRYIVPWSDPNVIEKESVDMVYSQAVLEHVDDLNGTYKALYSWLKPTGFMSHQIDFRCHGTSAEWNGHWIYSDFIWRLIRGNRLYLLNREPHSTHLNLLNKAGFKKVCDIKIHFPSKIHRKDLDKRFRNFSDDDLTTSGAFIQAVK
jgi:hypothetical protein